MQIRSLLFTNQVKLQNTKQNNDIKTTSYPNLKPLAKDTVSFGMSDPYWGIDLLALPPDRIIKICENALKENKVIGEGQEAYVVKVPRYPYCIRVEKHKGVKSKLGYDMNLNKYDKVNNVAQ